MTEYTGRKSGGKRKASSTSTHKRSDDRKRKESPLTGKRRGWILFIGIFTTAFCIFLIYSLYGLQIKQYEYYSQLASQQHWKRIKDEPIRGDILDAKGNVLASTTYVYTVGITPSDVRSLKNNKMETSEIAANIASSLGLNVADVTTALSNEKATYIQLAKNLSKDKIDKLNTYTKANGIGGIRVDSVAKRYYANGSLASQVLGYASATDGILIGQLGIEAQYNSALTGKEGYTYVEVDNYTNGALPYSAPTTIEAEDGYNVQLNIDQNIQKIAEDTCKEVDDIYDVIDGVTAIVMNPYTGAVLASTSSPGFDPNNPIAQPNSVDPAVWSTMTDKQQIDYIMSETWRNRAISDTYEPGSTFKAFTTAIALEEGLTNENEEFSDAPIPITSVDTISCWKQKVDGTNHGIETLKKAFENSCNPIFVQLARKIGISKYYEYVHNFGFYNQTGIDLPSEGVGIFHKTPTEVDLATLSFGESSTVTPLQLANAYCALVNGGTLMTPQIAKCLTDKNGKIVKEYQPVAIRTIFSEETANRVRKLMEGVVAEGTGTAGYVEGYNVAGKTSTSTTENGTYAGLHVLSFCGYAPANDPKIVVLVVVNKPADKLVGSSAATKAAANIISKTLEYMGVKHNYTDDDYSKLTTKYTVPGIVGMTYKEAEATLYKAGFTVINGEDNLTDDSIISASFPAKDAQLYKNGQVVLYSKATTESEMQQVVIPDFTGKDISEAQNEAELSRVNIIIEGNSKGVVVSQTLLDAKGNEENPVSPTPTGTDPGTGTPASENSPEATPAITTDPSSGQGGGNAFTKAAMGTIIRIVME